jgi:hypothetical protein
LKEFYITKFNVLRKLVKNKHCIQKDGFGHAISVAAIIDGHSYVDDAHNDANQKVRDKIIEVLKVSPFSMLKADGIRDIIID